MRDLSALAKKCRDKEEYFKKLDFANLSADFAEMAEAFEALAAVQIHNAAILAQETEPAPAQEANDEQAN